MAKVNNWVDKYGQSFMEFPLKGLTFKKAAWVENGHEHCLFCGKEIGHGTNSNSVDTQGYASTDDCWWACKSCFELFCQKYDIPIIKNSVESIEKALLNDHAIVLSKNNVQYFISKQQNEKIIVKYNGVTSEYKSFAEMEQKQKFYGKLLKDIIDDVFVGVK